MLYTPVLDSRTVCLYLHNWKRCRLTHLANHVPCVLNDICYCTCVLYSRKQYCRVADKCYKPVGDWISAPSPNVVAMAIRVGPTTFCMIPLNRPSPTNPLVGPNISGLSVILSYKPTYRRFFFQILENI